MTVARTRSSGVALGIALAFSACSHAPGPGLYRLGEDPPGEVRVRVVLSGDSLPGALGCPGGDDVGFNGCYLTAPIGQPRPLRWHTVGDEIEAEFCGDELGSPNHLRFRIGGRTAELRSPSTVGIRVVRVERLGGGDQTLCPRD